MNAAHTPVANCSAIFSSTGGDSVLLLLLLLTYIPPLLKPHRDKPMHYSRWECYSWCINKISRCYYWLTVSYHSESHHIMQRWMQQAVHRPQNTSHTLQAVNFASLMSSPPRTEQHICPAYTVDAEHCVLVSQHVFVHKQYSLPIRTLVCW